MTKGSMKGVVAAVAFALASTAPFAAHADCTQVGDAVSLNQFGPAFNGAAQLFITTGAFSGFTFFCNIFDPNLRNAAIAAASNKRRVVATGNAAVCPTSGFFRFMGDCTFIQLNP